MKTTKIDIDGNIPDRKYVREAVILAFVPVVIFSIIIITMALPATITVDSLRLVKLQIIRMQRDKRRIQYACDVLRSLSHPIRPSTILAITDVNTYLKRRA